METTAHADQTADECEDGEFTNIKAMLHHIAADEEVEAFCIVTFRKDGTAVPAHLNCKRRDMAFAAAILSHNSLEGED